MQHSTPQIIRFVIIRNPLVPDVKQIEDRVYAPGQSLADYIGELQGRYAFSVNGRVVSQDDLAAELPNPGDVVAIAPMPAGGGGGSKNIIRLVAIVALTVFTYGQSTWAMGSMMSGAGFGATATAVAQAAVMIGGAMLINAMLPMSIKNNQAQNDESRTYGIDGAKNTSTENIAVPVVYGRYRQAGNIIGNYTTLDGQTQYLHMLINAGEGVVAGVAADSILINDQPLSSLTDVEYKFFNGNDEQDTTGVFDRQITPNQVTVNRELKSKDVWTEYATSVEKGVEGLRLDFVASIYKLDGKGNQVEHSVDVEAQIKKYGDDDSQYVSFSTGVALGVSNKTWYLDLAGSKVSAGKTITERKVGDQMIDPTRPNKFDPKTGLYANYYVFDGKQYNLIGEAVTPKGGLATIYRYSGNRNDGPGRYSLPEDTVAEKVLPKSTRQIRAYEYGDLICDGVKVGTYHRFHPINKWVPGYNGSGPASGPASGSGVLRMSGNSASAAVRYSFESPRLPPGRYVVRVRRLIDDSASTNVGDSIVLNEVSEIIYSDISYNYTALLYLKLKISDQISSVPQVTFENLGRIIRVWDDSKKLWVASANIDTLGVPITPKERADFPGLTAAQNKQSLKKLGTLTPNHLALDRPAHMLPKATTYTDGFYRHDNPAWIAWDMLTDDVFGGGIPPSRLDFWAFKKWADYCDEKNLRFNSIIDQRDTLWDAIAAVFRVGRAIPVRTGTRYTVAIEMPKKPVMSFGVDNIIEGTFNIDWMSINDRANEVELTYYDKEYDYKQRTIKVYDKDSLTRGAKPITTSMKVIGITSEEQAIREANFALNTNKLVETVSFTAPVEALACTIGDVVSVQHNMVTWGEAGKLENAVGTGNAGEYRLTLDHEVTFESGKDWKINLQFSAMSRGRFVVSSTIGGYISLNGFNAQSVGRVKRAIVGGIETQVLDVFSNASGEQGVVLRDFEKIVPGVTVELFDTDVIVTANAVPDVYNVPTSTVTVAGLTQAPARFDHFMLGFSGFSSRLFTIRGIGLTGNDLTRQITAIEYDERVFNDEDTDFQVTDVAYERPLSPVSGVEITETPVFGGTELAVRMIVTWMHTAANYKEAEVQVSANNGALVSLGKKQNQASIDVKPGDKIAFTITPYSMTGKAGAPMTVNAVSGGIDTTVNTMIPAGGIVSSINGGNNISGIIFDEYATQKVEIWCMVEGTELPAIVTGASGPTTIEKLTSPNTVTSYGVAEFGVMIGYADKNGQFTHLVTDKALEEKMFFYWARNIDLMGTPSAMAYLGASKPALSTAYNDVTVYCMSVEVPARPVGGSYENPMPEGELWQRVPPTNREVGSKAIIYMSTRRFCSVEGLSDAEWTLPAAIYNPNDSIVIEPPTQEPTNVVVTSGFGSIRVTWDRPTYLGHDKTQVFVQRVMLNEVGQPAELPSLNIDTMKVCEEKSLMAVIPAMSGYGYFVWVRHVNEAGTVGPVGPEGGAYVVVRMTPDEMGAMLDGKIKFDFLDDDAAAIIDKASTDAKTAVENTQAVLDKALEAVDVAHASDQKAEESKELSETTAEIGLKLLIDANRIETDRRIEWYGPEGVRTQLEAFEKRVEGEGGAIQKLQQSIETVKGGATSGINELSESLALLDSSMATKVSEIYAKFKDVDTSTMASISSLQTAISDANKAVAALDQAVKANKTSADNALAAEVSARKMAITDEAGARALDVATLNTSITSVNTKVDNEIKTRQESVTTLTSSLSALETRLTGSITSVDSKVTTEIADRKTAITSVNNSISALDTRLTGSITSLTGTVNTEISDRKTAITSVNNSISALDTRLTGSITSLTSTVNTEIADRKTAITGVNSSIAALDTKLTGSIASVDSKVNTEISDRKTAITGVNSSISSLDTRLTGSITSVDSKVNTEIADRKTAITGVNSSITALDTKLTGSITSLTGTVNTEISDRKTAVTGLNSAITSLDSRLTSSIATERDRITTEISERKAAISNEQLSRAALESSLTASINGVSANVTNVSSALATLDGKYSAQWGIKTSVGALTGGVGFVNDGTTTSFLVDAAVFALISRNASGSVLRTSPFKVVNGKAYIADAYIDSAVINSIVARQITADYINALNITAMNIAANSTISAPNITGGTISIGSKFSVDADGKVTANGVSISGDIQAPNIKGGNVDGAIIRGGSIRGANIQASRFVVDSGMQVLSWANQEVYGTMDLPTIISKYGNDAPFVCDYDNVTGNVSASTSLGVNVMAVGATYKAGFAFPIASYNDSNRAKTFRYSRKLISPTMTCLVKTSPWNPGLYAELTLTFKVYCGSNVVWSWQAPKVGQNGSGGSIRPGSGVTWAMPNGTCTCSYTQYVESYSYGGMSKGEYLYVLNFTDMPFYGDGPMDVSITVNTMHPDFNNNNGNIIVFTIQDQANNSSQPTGIGPN